MALEEKYVRVFRKECNYLSYVVLDNLKKLSKDPKNKDYLDRLVQSADVIIGDSRFVEDFQLEQAATRVVKSFTGLSDARDKLEDLNLLTDVFEEIISRR